jgi:hypothetical protein
VGRLARTRVMIVAACAVLGARVGVARAEGAGVVVVPASRAASPANDVARAVASAASADADVLL